MEGMIFFTRWAPDSLARAGPCCMSYPLRWKKEGEGLFYLLVGNLRSAFAVPHVRFYLLKIEMSWNWMAQQDNICRVSMCDIPKVLSVGIVDGDPRMSYLIKHRIRYATCGMVCPSR
jgi:hypothetical protein